MLKKTNPHLLALSIFLIGFPFYFFKSGLPQPADFIFVFLSISLLISRFKDFIKLPSPDVIQPLLLFVAYTSLVNLLWGLISNEFTLFSSIIYPSYYIYNSLIFIVLIGLYNFFGQLALKHIFYGIIASVVLQCVLSPFGGREQLRQTLFFNNPNQLGYYIVLCSAIFFAGNQRFKLPALQQFIFYICAAYLVIISASKAAIASVILIIVQSFIKNIRVALFLSISLIVLMYALPEAGSSISEWSDPFVQNILHIGASDNLEGRAYDRIYRYPEYLVFGAGEGAFSRFHDHPREMHSSPGTLLFSYGAIGFLLFSCFLFRVIRPSQLKSLSYIVPVLFYGLTHQGLRFSLFWVLLAFSFCLGKLQTKEEKKNEDSCVLCPQQ